MAQSIVDFDQLEEDLDLRPIAETRPIDYAPPQYRERLPDYVEHSPGVSTIGALSAAAVVRMYEDAAAAIAAMGEGQKRVVERAEQIIAEAHAAMADCKALAEEYRERAKGAFETIEQQALLTAEVTKTCAELRKKIAPEAEPA